MKDADLVAIEVSRVIRAPKWRIIRLLTRVSDFPSYIPCVKDAAVIEKSRNTMKTQWQIEINKMPIRWIEVDTLELKKNAIVFEMVEGDFQVFKGKWQFLDHPEGTEVSINVSVKVSIPAIKDFARDYVTKILRRNFETVLESFEKHLISKRYELYRGGDKEKLAGFGIVGHLYNFYHLERSLKILQPDFEMPSREFLGRLYHVTPSFKMFDIENFISDTGEMINGCFILATFIPEMVEKDPWTILSKVVKACKIAEKHGVGIVSAGAFGNIAPKRLGHEISYEVDVPVTTGNTFTAAMVLEGICKAASLVGLGLSDARVVIVGANGDIGSGCSRVLADKVKELTLCSRSRKNLMLLKQELKKRGDAFIVLTGDFEQAAKKADVVIACASVTASIINVDWFKPGAIVCDVGYPKNVSSIFTRDDVLIFSGGLTKSPSPVAFPLDMGLPNENTLYGSYAEAIILALERRYENFSTGAGVMMPERIDEIKRLGEKHGFSVSDFYWNGNRVPDSTIRKVKGLIQT